MRGWLVLSIAIVLMVAMIVAVAEKVCKTSRPNSARHEAVKFLGHELRQCATAGLVGPLLLEGEKMLLHHLEKSSLLRLPARVDLAAW
jgi:hypothetical protein